MRTRRSSERGFTLIEIMVALGIMAILVGLSAGALRNYWLTQALAGSRDEVVNELRRSQERSVSESHPLVFGARFRVGSSAWGVVEFDPSNGQCREIATNALESGTQVSTASFTSVTGITDACDTQLAPTETDRFALFFARGSATAGQLTLTHPSLPGKSWTITVGPITGRVEAN